MLEETVRDVFRIRQWPRELALSAGVERIHLVFRARQLGSPLSVRPRLPAKLKNQITTGEGNVTQLLRVDEKKRMLYFLGVGREKGRDPYFIHLYRVGFDGKNLALLTPEDANHEVSLSPSGRYFVDSYSKPDVPPVTVLRDADGKLLSTISKRPISRNCSRPAGSRPSPITVKARDGVTDLYGLMFKPTNFDPSKKYPIVNHIYPGPQTGSVGSRSFSAARGDAQALAELGFIVVEIDGMGTPWRSKKFHEAYYGDMGDNTLPDQVTGMKQLAANVSVDRYRSRGHLRTFGRRLCDGRRDVPLSGFLQGRNLRSRQSRQSRVRGRLGREVAGPARTQIRAAPTTTTARRIRISRRI